MSEEMALSILNGIVPMPENVTVETVFHDAHVTPTIPTPY